MKFGYDKEWIRIIAIQDLNPFKSNELSHSYLRD